MKNNSVNIYIVCYALSFFLPIHLLWFYYNPAWFPLRSYLASIPLTLTLLLPAFYLCRFSKIWLVVVYPFFMLTVIFSGMHVYYYHTIISAQSFFAIMETSMAEAKEFLQSQFSFGALCFFLGLFFLPSFFLYKLLKMSFSAKKHYVFYGLCILLCFIYALIGQHRFLRDHQMWGIYNSYVSYKKISEEADKYFETIKQVPIKNVYDNLQDTPRTLVVVFGESSNRHHWSLYQYHRETNPLLAKIKDELFVFQNLVSAFATTQENISAILTFDTYENYLNFPLINILQALGYHVSWLSNQNTTEVRRIFHSILSADEYKSINHGGDQIYLHSYDENLLQELTQILQQTQYKKKVIFIHTMGSHVNYAARYPNEFEKFTETSDIPKASWRKGKALSYINHYDNSIVYTDYVLHEMINLLRDEPNSALLYLSDHGEEVYDSTNTHGHSNHLLSNYYVDIPMFFWLSEDFKNLVGEEKLDFWRSSLDKTFATDITELIIADMLNLKIENVSRQEDNPFSHSYKKRDRIIYGVNYDEKYVRNAVNKSE